MAPAAEREIIITWEGNAPREPVWRAWTEAAHVGHSWGPVRAASVRPRRADDLGSCESVVEGPPLSVNK